MKNIKSKKLSAIKFLGFILASQLLWFSCKKGEEPGPVGRLIFYTQIDSKEFDAIDIYINKKFAGKLISPNSKRPGCNDLATIGNMYKIDLPVGNHTWSARQFLKGKELDGWDEREEKITENDCEHIKLTD